MCWVDVLPCLHEVPLRWQRTALVGLLFSGPSEMASNMHVLHEGGEMVVEGLVQIPGTGGVPRFDSYGEG